MSSDPLVSLAIGILFAVLLLGGCRKFPDAPTPPSDNIGPVLRASWKAYKSVYLSDKGYVLDPRRAGVTSEGQGYALLRAALVGDSTAFARILEWTNERLQRSDGTYSWLWVPEGDGRVADRNTATDADQEIALALILAGHKFNRPEYLVKAARILQSIREVEGIPVNGRWFPAAGNWAVEDRIVNLSYFLPYAYPYFDRIDPNGNWTAVHKTGYRLLWRALARPAARLIPDFLVVSEDGSVGPVPETSELSSRFSFDAMRIYWRVATDCLLHRTPTACTDPAHTDEVVDLLARDGSLYTEYSLDGTPQSAMPSPTFYASLLPALRLHRPTLGKAISASYVNAEALENLSAKSDRYYDSNWVWFGLAADSGWLSKEMPDPNELQVPRELR